MRYFNILYSPHFSSPQSFQLFSYRNHISGLVRKDREVASFLKANQSWKNNFGPKLFKKWKKQWLNINGKNAFEYSLRLGLYLKVECMNLSETNFSRTAESDRFKLPFATSGPPNSTNTGDNHKNNYKNIILEKLRLQGGFVQ